MKANRISIIKPWATVTSGSRVMVILVSCCLHGRRCHLAFFHYSAPTQHPALFTDALVQLCGSAFPQICSLSSPCHLKDTETSFRQSFFFSFENSTLACNFQSSGLHGWKKGSLTAHPRLTHVKDFLRVISYMPTTPQGRVKRDQPEWSFLFPLQRSFPQEYVQSFSSRIDCFRDLVYKLVYLLKMS